MQQIDKKALRKVTAHFRFIARDLADCRRSVRDLARLADFQAVAALTDAAQESGVNLTDIFEDVAPQLIQQLQEAADRLFATAAHLAKATENVPSTLFAEEGIV